MMILQQLKKEKKSEIMNFTVLSGPNHNENYAVVLVH